MNEDGKRTGKQEEHGTGQDIIGNVRYMMLGVVRRQCSVTYRT